MRYSGKWRITEMEMWDSDYFDMEVEAYIEINPDSSGEFQFGLVYGQINGKVAKDGDGEQFRFRWNGSDECDEASGSGWLKLKGKNSLNGYIKLHHGDSSNLVAKRMKNIL